MFGSRKAALWGLLLVVVVVAAAIGIPKVLAFLNPPLPPPQPVREARWLDQGWSGSDRYWFHHASQGTSTLPIPYVWFVSLAEPKILPGKEKLYINDGYMQKLGFIPSPPSGGGQAGPAGGIETAYGYKTKIGGVPAEPGIESNRGLNPAGMPVGFAITKAYPDPVTGKMLPDQVGLTCAACHTGHLEYNGVSLRIDGANASTSLGQLTSTLGAALFLTDLLPWRFDSFADRVLGPKATKAERKQLHADLKATIKALAAGAKATSEIDKRDGVTEGYNRLDALNRIGNQVFYANLLAAKSATFDPLDNYAAVNAPVKYPHLWNTPWFNWAQYDGSIGQPAIRNVGEAIGVQAKVNMTTFDQPHKLWDSSVAVGNVARMEQQIEGPNPLALGLQPGVTNPATGVTCFTTPTTPATEMTFGQALASAVQFVVDKFHIDEGTPIKSDAAQADKGNRPNCVQAPPAYKARPLNGIWATPPYLHNGSVPTLTALLGPPAERPSSFCLGNRAYDPILVGLDVKTCPRGAFKLDTSIKGSSNQGHEFRDAPAGTKGVVGPALSPQERAAVIEFLKTQ